MAGLLGSPESDVPRNRRDADSKWVSSARIVIFIAALVLMTLASVPPRPNPERLLEEQVGEPASRTVMAPFPLKVVDQQTTMTRRQEVEDKVPPTYARTKELLSNKTARWKALVQLAEAGGNYPAGAALTSASQEIKSLWASLARADQDRLRANLLDPTWRSSVIARISRTLEESDILRGDWAEPISSQNSRTPVLWRVIEPDGRPTDRMSWISVRSVTQEQEATAQRLVESAFNNDAKARNLALALSRVMIDSTLEFDAAATEQERALARASVPSVSIEFKQNQALIRRGEIVTENQRQALLELRERTESRFGEVLGRSVLVCGILLVLFGYLKRGQREIYNNPQRLAAFLGELAFVSWCGFFVSWGVEFDAISGTQSSISQVGLIVPVAAAGLLAVLLENQRLGLISVIISTFLVGAQFNWEFDILLVLALSGIVGVFHVGGISRRSQVYLGWPWLFGSGAMLLFGVHLVMYPSWEAFRFSLDNLFWGWLWLGVNGLISVGLTLLLLPILEDLLGITTEFKLREISSYHPLLKQLEEKAPGTYYHSINVSALAESAAAAIGANAVLVKVGAYYHDIGKMEKPSYFAENQFTEEDRRKHSKISPHMSCLIIRNHVKLGLEMARENRLPEAIFPFIAEHHGTTLLSYFYDQARSEDPHGTVSESDFRYPGPKPQTIESAILMLADTIEAASRSMKLVGEGEIRVFVKRIINDKMVDGQFDECNLTFRQIRILMESFTRTLRTMMHRRIAYPSMPEVDLSPSSQGEEKVQPLFNRGA